MTIVVWDGQTLATDRQANDGSQKWETDKAWYVVKDNKPYIVSGVGVLQDIILLREWFTNGAKKDEFPISSRSNRMSYTAQLVVVSKNEGLMLYEGTPHPVVHGFTPCAFGDGKDFSLGALSMGATSTEAVGIANEHSLHCGKGITELTLNESKAH
jgi:hypothetical protein